MDEKGTALIALFLLALLLILINTLSTFELPSLKLQLFGIILLGLAFLVIGYTYKGRQIEKAQEPPAEDRAATYVKQALLKNLTEEEITVQLRHAGWQEPQIIQAFRRARFF